MTSASSAPTGPGIDYSAPFMQKEWESATKGLKYTSIKNALSKILRDRKDTSVPSLTSEKEMIEAVKELSLREDLPSIVNLMGKVSSVFTATSAAAKLLIAAQLLRSNRPEIEKLTKEKKEQAIKALILGGRWMIERGEFIKKAETVFGKRPQVSTSTIRGKHIKYAFLGTAMMIPFSIIVFPFIGIAALAVTAYQYLAKT